MKFTLKKFYSNNYKDFIHLEALKNILRQVPRLKLAEVKNIDNVLSMEFSVDEWGENPMYITYLDDEGKKHIVKIRPAVTEQIYEILKEYAKITYVDEQDQKIKDELRDEMAEGDENTLNSAKEYTDIVVNNAKAEINLSIETAKEDLKAYCDNKCELTLISSKNYTDAKADELHQRIDEEHEYNRKRYVIGTINKDGLDTGKRFTEIGLTPRMTKYAHYVNFVDARDENHEINHAGGYLLDYDGYTNLVTNLSRAGIPIYLNTGTGEPLFVSEIAFTLAQYNNQDFMWANIKDGVNDLRAILINEENMQKLYDLDLSGYASKEELDALDTKVDLVNQQVEENKTSIENNSNRIDDANQLITDNDAKVSEEIGNINDKLDNLPRSSEVTRTGGIHKERLNVEIDSPNDFYSSVYLEQRDGSDGEFAGRLVKGDVAKKEDLDALSKKVDDLPTGGSTVDHTLSVVTETGYGSVENDIPATAIRFSTLVLSGETPTVNHVSVETKQGQKVFNFLPDGINKDWFTQKDDEVQQIILDADEHLQEYFQWQTQTNDNIDKIMQIISSSNNTTPEKLPVSLSNIILQTDGGTDMNAIIEQINSYYVTFGDLIYIKIELSLISIYTTSDATTLCIDFDIEKINGSNATLSSLLAFTSATNGNVTASYTGYIDSYVENDIIKNHYFFINPVKSNTNTSDGVFISTNIEGFISTLN